MPNVFSSVGELFLDFLGRCGGSLHPLVLFDLSDGEAALVVILEHGGDEVEEVLRDETEVQVVGLGDRAPIRFILLITDELVKVIVALSLALGRHVAQHHHVQDDPCGEQVSADANVGILLEHLRRHVALGADSRVHDAVPISGFHGG